MGSLMPEIPEPGSYERNDDVICDTTKVVHRPGGHGVRKGTIVRDGKGCYKLPDDEETGQSPMDQIPQPVPAQHTSSPNRNKWKNTKRIRKKQVLRAASKTSQAHPPLQNQVADLDDTLHPDLRSVSGAANEAGNSGRICRLHQTVPLWLPKNIPHIPLTLAGAVRSVRAESTHAEGKIGQTPKRVVQQSALVAAADQARRVPAREGPRWSGASPHGCACVNVNHEGVTACKCKVKMMFKRHVLLKMVWPKTDPPLQTRMI